MVNKAVWEWDLTRDTTVTHANGSRIQNEIRHGQALSREDPERLWGWKSPAGRARAKRRAEMITSGARLAPGCLALEIGCGTGMFTEMFAQTGAEIVAIDVSVDLIAQAKVRNLGSQQVKFLVGRFEDCAFENRFDAVIGSSVLHHLELETALVKIREILKPGGLISFAEPNMLNPQVFLERTFRFLPCFSYVSPDETAFLSWKLKRALQKSGFHDAYIVPFDWLHPRINRNLIITANRAGMVLEHIPLIRQFAGSLYIQARCS